MPQSARHVDRHAFYHIELASEVKKRSKIKSRFNRVGFPKFVHLLIKLNLNLYPGEIILQKLTVTNSPFRNFDTDSEKEEEKRTV